MDLPFGLSLDSFYSLLKVRNLSTRELEIESKMSSSRDWEIQQEAEENTTRGSLSIPSEKNVCACRIPSPVAIDLSQEEGGQFSQELHNSFRKRGWAILRVNKEQAETYVFKGSSQTDWKSECIGLFRDSGKRRLVQESPILTFRESESGDATSTRVEPKESIELQRFNLSSCLSSPSLSVLAGCCSLMHQVAIAARKLLHLPPNLLLQEQDNKRNIDLLRSFYYHTTPGHDETCFGSNAHTDWGSFTVILQDDNAERCLETFCTKCCAWMPLACPVKQSGEDWDFVVHLGDVTSLAIRQAQKTILSSDEPRDLSLQSWPSPLHRVISPRQNRRLSLVYFAYPPVEYSLQQVINGIHEWTNQQIIYDREPAIVTSLSDYFLLRDQKQNGRTGDQEDSAKRILDEILCLPFQEVFERKWNEVQR